MPSRAKSSLVMQSNITSLNFRSRNQIATIACNRYYWLNWRGLVECLPKRRRVVWSEFVYWRRLVMVWLQPFRHNVTFQESNFRSRLKCLQVWNDNAIQFACKLTIPSPHFPHTCDSCLCRGQNSISFYLLIHQLPTFHILGIHVCGVVNIQIASTSWYTNLRI
jgi:hypothetical protein